MARRWSGGCGANRASILPRASRSPRACRAPSRPCIAAASSTATSNRTMLFCSRMAGCGSSISASVARRISRICRKRMRQARRAIWRRSFSTAPPATKRRIFMRSESTVYRMFSRCYPYGEIEPFSRPRFAKPPPLAHKRPDLPSWLDAAILKAIAVDARRSLRRRVGVRLRARKRLGARAAVDAAQEVPLRTQSPPILANALFAAGALVGDLAFLSLGAVVGNSLEPGGLRRSRLVRRRTAPSRVSP